jgi:uncharacterized protein YneF (UPF0154 family)
MLSPGTYYVTQELAAVLVAVALLAGLFVGYWFAAGRRSG